jgi:uncharacterized membrane protein
MPNIHPVLAHFTIALFVAAVIFDLIGYFTRNESLKAAGRWNLLFASISAISSVITGLSAASVIPHNDEVHEIIETHELVGYIVLGILTLLVVWRLFVRGSFPARFGWLFLSIGLIGIGLVLTGGYLGGEMVYRHGLGVAPMIEHMSAEHGHLEYHQGQSDLAESGLESASPYSCPMHPEVISGKSGLCPKCGMALVKIERNPSDSVAIDSEKPVHTHKDGSNHTH